MDSIITSTTGYIHFIAGIFSLALGTTVLLANKGTQNHKRLGYLYVISMVVLNVTAFMIYRLFDGWGIFHWAALISTFSILAGMIPAIFLRHKKYWLPLHYTAMYWSVFGLYGAFVAESLVRIPDSPFFWMVGLAVFIVMAAGAIGFGYYKKHWAEKYGSW